VIRLELELKTKIDRTDMVIKVDYKLIAGIIIYLAPCFTHFLLLYYVCMCPVTAQFVEKSHRKLYLWTVKHRNETIESKWTQNKMKSLRIYLSSFKENYLNC